MIGIIKMILDLPLHTPNAETLQAMAELENGHGFKFNSIEELMSDLMEIEP